MREEEPRTTYLPEKHADHYWPAVILAEKQAAGNLPTPAYPCASTTHLLLHDPLSLPLLLLDLVGSALIAAVPPSPVVVHLFRR